MELKIREGDEDDFPAILKLIQSLADYENATEKVTNTVERMKKDQPFFNFFVAEKGGEIVGFALYYFAYYTWVGKSLYLDDLYVKKAYRGQKIGTQLLSRIFDVAQKEDCQRVRWQVLDWNADAIAFYKKIGADIDKEWYNCDFDAEMIKNM